MFLFRDRPVEPGGARLKPKAWVPPYRALQRLSWEHIPRCWRGGEVRTTSLPRHDLLTAGLAKETDLQPDGGCAGDSHRGARQRRTGWTDMCMAKAQEAGFQQREQEPKGGLLLAADSIPGEGQGEIGRSQRKRKTRDWFRASGGVPHQGRTAGQPAGTVAGGPGRGHTRAGQLIGQWGP